MRVGFKQTLIQLGTSISLAITTVTLTDLVRLSPIDIGWHYLTIFYLFILIGQILFYYLSTYTKVLFTILSFTLNFILWMVEQVSLEKFLNDTALYQDENLRYVLVIIGGILFAMNKLIIDRLFILIKLNLTGESRLERILYSRKPNNP